MFGLVRAAVAPNATRAVCADGGGAGTGSVGGFWPGGMGDGGRQTEASAFVSDRVESFPESVTGHFKTSQ